MVAGSRVGLHFLTSALKLLEPRLDDDFVDRLHYLYTSIILLMFAVLVSAKQYVGHPIECFVPAYFTRAMEQYSENYCYIQNTYWIPFQDHIPHRLEEREKRQIGYYQWVPFVLSLAALMFHLPASIWRMLSSQSGLNVGLVLQTACNEQNIDPDIRDRTVEILARHVEDALRYQRDLVAKSKSVFLFALVNVGRVYGAYVTVVYSFVKLLHLSNSILQFYFLNKFLETADYPLFGGHVLYDLLRDREWRDSGRFPRVTLCDFEIRVLGNIHRHTVQCVLVINMFLEKIFIFLWLWILFLAFLSAVNLAAWLATVAVPFCRQAFVEKYLDFGEGEHKSSMEISLFVEKFLRPDGVLLLKMVSIHAGNIMCTKMTEALWVHYVHWRNSSQVAINRKESLGSTSISRVDRVRRRSSERRRSPPREDREPPLGRQSTPPPKQSLLNISAISDTRHYV
ncbi:innexin domain-containing protein [Ditylenchus destructor]|uniref:Innexin n=1 Tax=Ditylenchus destructor TaxID=166010 RepID=A0AAD4N3M9_9BILA|nr:innexin domain-containing protein [Ditylenchus destructor]